MKSDKEYLEEIYEKHKEVATSKYKDEFYQMKWRESKIKPLKMVAVFVFTIGVTVGIVYASNRIQTNENNKIWKEPQVYEFNPKEEIAEEEVEKCIPEEEAKKLGAEALAQIGLAEDTILNLKLEKAFFSHENEWQLASSKATIVLNGETGELKSVQVPTWNYRIPYHYGITRKEAKEVAWQLLEKYRPEKDKGEYQLVKLTRNMETDEASYIWYAQFYKKYGDLLNPYEEIYIGWIPTINGIYSLTIKKNEYENNSEKITEQEAIEIAKNKDRQIETNKTISEVKAEIRIQQMNADVFLRENYKEQYEKHEFSKYNMTQYLTEERVRKVWCVVITYEDEKQYTYFVDCTTGEIIGGNNWDTLDNEKVIEQDLYNFAK